jgi:hypothetical protein
MSIKLGLDVKNHTNSAPCKEEIRRQAGKIKCICESHKRRLHSGTKKEYVTHKQLHEE